MRERDGEKGESGWEVRRSTNFKGTDNFFPALRVPRQCMLVLVGVHLRESAAVREGKGS
jgi:hypothetical protein